jgi:hypothetical protein
MPVKPVVSDPDVLPVSGANMAVKPEVADPNENLEKQRAEFEKAEKEAEEGVGDVKFQAQTEMKDLVSKAADQKKPVSQVYEEKKETENIVKKVEADVKKQVEDKKSQKEDK